MSLSNQELETVLAFQADMDLAIAQKDWKKCTDIIFACADAGYEHESKLLNASYVRAKTEDAESIFPKDDEKFLREYAEQTGWDPRDDADRNRP